MLSFQHPTILIFGLSPYPITFLHYDMYFSQSNPFQMLDFTVKSNYKSLYKCLLKWLEFFF